MATKPSDPKTSDPRHAGFMAIQDHINREMTSEPPNQKAPVKRKSSSKATGGKSKEGPFGYLKREGM